MRGISRQFWLVTAPPKMGVPLLYLKEEKYRALKHAPPASPHVAKGTALALQNFPWIEAERIEIVK